MNVEYIGTVASVIVLLSFIVRKEKNIRCINLVGSALLTLYGVLLDAFSVYTLNGILCLVHLYHLYKLARADSKNKQTTHRR